jgi:hypothetical protein
MRCHTDLPDETGIPRSEERPTGVTVDNDKARDVPVPVASGQPGGSDAGLVLLLVNGVIAAVGGSYAGTHSVIVTVVAGCAGVVTAALVVWKRG